MVRDKAVHLEVIQMVMDYAASIGFRILNLDFSPVRGPEGNIEYLLYLQKGAGEKDEAAGGTQTFPDAAAVVEESHRVLED